MNDEDVIIQTGENYLDEYTEFDDVIDNNFLSVGDEDLDVDSY